MRRIILAAAIAAFLPLGASAEGGAPAPAAPDILASPIDSLDFWIARLGCKTREPQEVRMSCYASAGRLANLGAAMLVRNSGQDI